MRSFFSKLPCFGSRYWRYGMFHGLDCVISRLKHTVAAKTPSVCVIGSGPAGFGITQYLLKNHKTLRVHMLEKCPIPYGLIRYGVTPDHQDVKNCIHTYEKVAKSHRFSFYGGVDVGNVVSLSELSKISDAIVLCTGAQEPLKLDIPGENLTNVFSAKEIVGWYNGKPEQRHISPDLSGETAVIIGVGNVALDCARMLLKPSDRLRDTDITSLSFDALQKSNIKNVVVVGRRGPLQMSCARRELSEITELDDVVTETDQTCFTKKVKLRLTIKDFKLRRMQRVVKHLMDVSCKNDESSLQHSKKFTVKLLHSPAEIFAKNGKVDSILLQENVMSGDNVLNPQITSTENFRKLQCSLVISAIGYGNKPLDTTIPFSEGRIEEERGRIDHPFPLYACGWCKTGAKGVLGDTLNDCLITGGAVVENLHSASLKQTPDDSTIENLLIQKGVKHFRWEDWKTIDDYEVNHGAELGKVREKVVSWERMREIAFAEDADA